MAIAFNMSDKSLLLKLHAIALQKSNLNTNRDYRLLNSAVVDGDKIPEKPVDYTKIAQKDGKSIKYFNRKDGKYEVGILVPTETLKKAGITPFMLMRKDYKDARSAYDAIDDKTKNPSHKNNTKLILSNLKKYAYKELVKYMTFFCGEEYALSISENRLICEAYSSENQAYSVDNGVLGKASIQGSAKETLVGVVLYKIGYSIGAKK